MKWNPSEQPLTVLATTFDPLSSVSSWEKHVIFGIKCSSEILSLVFCKLCFTFYVWMLFILGLRKKTVIKHFGPETKIIELVNVIIFGKYQNGKEWWKSKPVGLNPTENWHHSLTPTWFMVLWSNLKAPLGEPGVQMGFTQWLTLGPKSHEARKIITPDLGQDFAVWVFQ